MQDGKIYEDLGKAAASAGSPAAAAAISRIHAFQKFGSILGLERMNRLLELLGNPQEDLKVLHVAGTNGKGSICRYLYCALEEAGYKTGLFISPHIEVFNERIEADGRYISDEDLAFYTDRVLAKVKEMEDAGDQPPTEFEVITAVAFLYFQEQKCDYVVLEVGLGGRGDSTNVCREPLVSVIASISFDHTDRLGNTLAEIAAEKAGIIKDGCPVVTSCEADEALNVIRATAEKHGCMYTETRHIPYRIKEESLNGCRFDVDFQGVLFEDLEISMAGEHQVKNAVAALAALCILEERGEIRVPRTALYAGFRKARQPGRLETAGYTGENDAIPVILDGAHNPDGARVLRNAMNRFCGGKKILLVTGMLVDKDVKTVMKYFQETADGFILTEPENPRKLSAHALAQYLDVPGAVCIEEPDTEKACRQALKLAAREGFDFVLFSGSLYLIGSVRGVLRKIWREKEQ
ncbi:MAG: bifunctional folylpolyglutamate synthase/dihydrofolate synthase [Firmicutes bacterium]|nr:bifunctional folylpolyglutamate synthase/dihydrofolate synthase [Bacillota bacterium]MDY5855841.1 folylpolyglutamate synthase/dihydrofolate synthase family protein [Anaerovoracaceae bacterium]